MGFLARFNLGRLRSAYGCSIVFETGTGMAGGTLEAAKFPFDRIYTVEIHPQIAEIARTKIAHDKRIVLLEQSSEDALRDLMPTLPKESSVLFWLDAHFPGKDFGFSTEKEPELEISLPLEKELELICSLRSVKNDVFLIDDLRIYEDGPYFNGMIAPGDHLLSDRQRSIEFIKRILGATHYIFRYYYDEGYVVCLPRAQPMPKSSSLINERSLKKRIRHHLAKRRHSLKDIG